jgi:single-strand DNA-binding protein
MAMLYEAHISLTGYVATQPVVRLVKEGVTNVSMRVAWTPRRQDRTSGEWVDTNTSYATVYCWRKLATNAAISLRKGDPVALQGRVSVREFQDREGRPRTSVEIDATSIGHDLTRGVATFQRVRPQTGKTAAEFAASQNGEHEHAVNGAGPGGGGDDGADGPVGVGMGVGGDGEPLPGQPLPGQPLPGQPLPGQLLPDEPDRPFFNEAAISDEDDSEEVAAAA